MTTAATTCVRKSTFQLVGTVLCVAQPIADYSEPKLHIHYWPIGETSREWRESNSDVIGGEATDNRDGSYSFRHAAYNYSNFRLQDGGQTKPIKTDVVEVPQPKTRCRTRWYYGRWQKLLKSEGWVNL